jgi:hypothetical protein
MSTKVHEAFAVLWAVTVSRSSSPGVRHEAEVLEPRLTPAPMLSLYLDEFCRCDDLHALVLTDLQQVFVSRDEVFGAASGRALDDAVVSRVFFDDIYSLRWLDMLGKMGNMSDCLIDLLFGPAEFVAPQNFLDFIEDRIRDGKIDGTICGHFKDAPGIA